MDKIRLAALSMGGLIKVSKWVGYISALDTHLWRRKISAMAKLDCSVSFLG